MASSRDVCSRHGPTAVLVKQQLEALNGDLSEFVTNKIDSIIDVVKGGQLCRSCAANSPTRDQKHATEHIDAQEKLELCENGFKRRHFKHRESILTTMLESQHAQALYNFCFGFLALCMIYSLILTIVQDHTLGLRFDLIWFSFGQFPTAMSIWCCLLASTVLVHPVFEFWANVKHLPKKNERILLWTVYISFLVVHLVVPLKCIYYFELPPASTYIVMIEQLRQAMKIHSFVRENYPRALKWKSLVSHRQDSSSNSPASVACPAFEQYWYFLWAPILLYRDSYPRLNATNWSKVWRHFANGLACIVYCNYIMTYIVQGRLKNFGPADVTLASTVLALFELALPGQMCVLLLFWGLVHSWANMWCELLRFADRKYYNEWWNSKRMSSFYRDWNLVVYEWLYEYILKDVAKCFPERRKGTMYGTIAVFFVSALVHEYTFIVGLRLFCPVMFLLYFCFGPILMFISRMIKMEKFWNVMLFGNLIFGNGLFMGLYSREWYARVNCQPVYEGVWDFLIPLSWTCEQTKHNTDSFDHP